MDCDVHAPVPSIDELAEYLPDHWALFLREVGFEQFVGVNYTYPPASSLRAGASDAASVEDLAKRALDGVELAVLTMYYGFESHSHPYLGEALARAVNNWVRERWLDGDSRLRGSISVAPQYAELAAAEIRRCAEDDRFVQVILPARSWEPYGAQRFLPIWEAAAEAGLVVAITYGGQSGTPPSPVGWLRSFFEEYAAFQQVFAAHVSSIVTNGIFNRFPTMKVVLLESGWTWLPGLYWRMDSEWKAVRREVAWVSEPPSEYIKRHFRLGSQPIDAEPAAIRHAVDHLGSPEMLMYGSDFPRSYEPGIDTLLAELGPEEAQRVLWSNAAETYGIGNRAASAV